MIPNRHTLLIIIASVLGCTGSWALFESTWQRALTETAAAFQDAAAARAAAIQSGIDDALDDLAGLADLFEAVEGVTQSQFEHFARRRLGKYPGSMMLEWMPRTAAADREEFEARARSFHPDYTVHPLPASDAPDFYPVLMIAPGGEDRSLLGLNFTAAPERRQRLERAIELGGTIASRVHRVPGRPELGEVLFLLRPVFPAGDSGRPPKGLAAMRINVAQLISEQLVLPPAAPLTLTLVDPVASTAHIYHEGDDGTGSRPATEIPIKVADRTWQLRIAAGPGAFSPNPLPYYALLGTGVALTLLLTAYGWDYTRRSRRTEALVLTRTAELQRESQRLTAAMAALEASERRLKGVIDHAPAVIYLKGLDLRYQLSNAEFSRQFDLPSEQIRGHDDFALLPKDAEQLRANDLQVLAGREALQFEEQVQTRFGRRTYLSVKFPLLDRDGEPIGLCGISTDISEFKETEARLEQAVEARTCELSAANAALSEEIAGHCRTEAALRESEARWRSLVENAPDLIFVIDHDHRILFVNDRRLEEGPEQPLGSHALALVAPEHRAAAHAAIDRAFRELSPQHLELRVAGRGRGPAWLSAHLGPVLREGQVVAVVVIARDVTQRRRMVQALRARDANLRAITQNASDGILVHVAGRIVFANRRLARLLGYSSRTLRRMEVWELIPLEEAHAVKERFRRRFGGEPVAEPYETQLLDQSGERIPVEVTGARILWEGSQAGLVMFRDMRERRSHQAQLARTAHQLARKAHHLVRANEELERFSYVVSHDLKAPLRAVSHLLTSLEEDLGPRLDAEERGRLEMVRGRVQRMDRLIDGLLHYSRIGFEQPVREEIDTETLVAEVIQGLDVPAGFTIATVAPLPRVIAHRLQLSQVFANLMGNALSHHDRAAGCVRVAALEHPGEVEFVVSDDGPGVPPDYRERVFEIFQTLTARDRRESTGIGLALVRKLVTGWGGRVWVDDAPGGGAAFHFTLPGEPPGSEEVRVLSA